MDEFAELLSAERYKDRQWKEFRSHFRDATLIKAGGKLARTLKAQGYVIIWSTTRDEQYARVTYQWLQHHSVPVDHLLCRSIIKDGSRPQWQVKLRHYWNWIQAHPGNPVIAWIDDDVDAVAELIDSGCPTWNVIDLARRAKNTDIRELLDAGPIPPAELSENARRTFPLWNTWEQRWQQRRSEWKPRHLQRLRNRRRR